MLEKVFLHLLRSNAALLCHLPNERSHALRCRWARQDTVDRHAGALGGLREAAREGELRGFGEPVVNHLGGGVDPRFAGDEHDPAPAGGGHLGQIEAAQAHAAEHVDLEEPRPVGVRDVRERLGLEDAEVVNEHIDGGHLLDECLHPIGRAQVGRDAADFGPDAEFGFQTCDGFIHAGLGATVDNDLRALARQCQRDAVSDARGRTADECLLSGELQVHREIQRPPSRSLPP